LAIKPVAFGKISMGRAWRIEYKGALYHLMSRGNDGHPIYLKDAYIMQLSYYIHRNPLRAEIVSRLIDYKWGSYQIR